MIITIGGRLGSGKSTLAKMLAEKLGYKLYSMGNMRRKIASDRGMTIEELNALGENEAWTDTEVDEYQKKLGESEDNFVIEGRTSFYFIPQSLKIYIDVSEQVGAERIFGDLQSGRKARNEGRHLTSVEAVLASNRQRVASDEKRYHKYYGIDVYDQKNFDFILDTTTLTIEPSFTQLYEFVQKRLNEAPGQKN